MAVSQVPDAELVETFIGLLVRIRHSHNVSEDIGLGTLSSGVGRFDRRRKVERAGAIIDDGTRARRPAFEKCPANPIPPSPPCLAG
jgi:hypothetical protein